MSERYPGGIITKNPATPTGPFQTGAAPGVWTLEQQMQFVQQGVWPTAGLTPNYIEDMFSCFLYTGTGATPQTITNGIDLSTKGGLVWVKNRTNAFADHALSDTAQGTGKYLVSNTTAAQETTGNNLTAFNANGFTVGSRTEFNQSGANIVSWTFRKQPKFFDVVTWSPNGSGDATVAHSLNSVPGSVFIKKVSATSDWQVYHRSLATNNGLYLNTTDAAQNFGTWISVSSTQLSMSGYSAGTYVAYIFAHDAGGFGLSGTDNVISCGSYVGNGLTAGPQVTLGYEPQWVLRKNATAARGGPSTAGAWSLVDNMRGMSQTTCPFLFANSSASEDTSTVTTGYIIPNATGFVDTYTYPGDTYIYVAIRRGPMAVPTLGTSVFEPAAYTGNGTNPRTVGTLQVTDLAINMNRPDSGDVPLWVDRLRGPERYLYSSGTAAEAGGLTGWLLGQSGQTINGVRNTSPTTYIDWLFRRAPSFFDEVCFTGTGSTLVLNHNLTVAPELIIGKRRTGGSYWILGGNFGASTYWYKNDWGANDSSTSSSYSGGLSFGAQPTSTTVTLDNNSALNVSAYNAVLWMWATCPGVSKVGTYTGTGTLQTIPCGFTTGARFVLVTRVGVVGNNSTYIYDSARGITSSNDPYLLFNTSDPEVTGTNYVDTDTTGFKVTAAASSTLNVSSASYIFLAIA